jgi:hypothetical protein
VIHIKPIRVFDKEINLLAEIDDYESLQFTRRFYTYGEFEININLNKNNTEYLQKDNIIVLGKDTNKIGIIKHKEIEISEDGMASETVKVIGYTIDYLFGYRTITPPTGQAQNVVAGDAESVMKHYINDCIINPTNIGRKIDLFNLTDNQNRGINISWGSRFKNLSEELNNISLYSNMGISTTFNTTTKKIDIDVYEGKDLTQSQSINNPVIFSHIYDNIKSQHYVDSDFNYKNYAYVGGQGEGVDRTIVEIGEDTGIDRIETFIDARDISETSDLEERGRQALVEFAQVKTLEGDILQNNSFVYEQDWNLGDIVTVFNKKWGVTMDTRITEIKEIFEPDGFNLEVVFGNNVPTLIDVIKSRISNVNI